jgi:hypothetical protein
VTLTKKLNALPLFWIIAAPLILAFAVLIGYYAATRSSFLPEPPVAQTHAKPATKAVSSGAQAPKKFAQKIEALGAGFDGDVGIAIR